MCAIMGFSKKELTREEVSRAFRRTRSRGPDATRILETPSQYDELPYREKLLVTEFALKSMRDNKELNDRMKRG